MKENVFLMQPMWVLRVKLEEFIFLFLDFELLEKNSGQWLINFNYENHWPRSGSKLSIFTGSIWSIAIIKVPHLYLGIAKRLSADVVFPVWHWSCRKVRVADVLPNLLYHDLRSVRHLSSASRADRKWRLAPGWPLTWPNSVVMSVSQHRCIIDSTQVTS